MLKYLRIQNIILVEEAEIAFEAGFNVLTGETGSGKSALINALYLVTGERADVSIIRFGQNKGSVEAIFDMTHLSHIFPVLEEAGVDEGSREELIIRREIHAAGKSRAFVNNQSVQLHFLRHLAPFLLQMAGQHINQKLLSVDNHRNMVDAFGNLEGEVKTFSCHWETENKLRSELQTFIQSRSERLRECDRCQIELAELDGACLKPNEEEKLFAEYQLLTNSQSLLSKIDEVEIVLSGQRSSVLPTLNKLSHTFDQLVRIDSSLTEIKKTFQSLIIELEEIAYTMRDYGNKIESDPERAKRINERLTLIHKLKKRYGETLEEIQAYYAKTKKRLDELQHCDDAIETMQDSLRKMEEKTLLLSQQLTKKRREASFELQKMISEELRQLNMPKAQFFCKNEFSKTTKSGNDYLEFFLAPNLGEQSIPIRECASGGELARVMLALQTVLAGKEAIPTIAFDEIDANIGGATALVVGKKLAQIGKNHQIICITHFPQVAMQADHHIQIFKEEHNNRTFTLLQVLKTREAKERELARMAGKCYSEPLA